MTQRLLYDTKKEARLESVREIRVILLRLLSLKRVGETLSNRISLAFTEAATNIIKHGNPKAGTLQVTLSQDGDHFYLAIMDDGEPWDITSRPYQGLDSVLQDHESGRRIQINPRSLRDRFRTDR